jgi:hypothetical protein
MVRTAPAPCIPDEGVIARIPDSPFSVLTLVEVRNRLNSDPDAPDPTPEVLSKSMNLSLAQVYAGLAYYHANQSLFDAELERRQQATRQTLDELFARHASHNSWAEMRGAWPGDETDEEVNALLEELS